MFVIHCKIDDPHSDFRTCISKILFIDLQVLIYCNFFILVKEFLIECYLCIYVMFYMIHLGPTCKYILNQLYNIFLRNVINKIFTLFWIR